MLSTIIGKEIKEILGSLKFAVTFGVCAVLILLSFYVGAESYNISQARYEAAKTENFRQLEGLTDWFGIQQYRIFLPPQPLESLVNGVANDIGRTIEVHGRGELVADDSKYGEEPIFAIFRFIDLEFIFQFILSLFAILFGFNAISGEKEQGTLRLVFANALPRYKYILGKLIGYLIALVIPLLAALALGCLLLIIMRLPLSGDDWLRLGLIIISGLLYFGVFLTLSIFISSLTRRSSNSLIMILVIWILAILIIPRSSVLIAGRTVDVPSLDELTYKKNKYRGQLWTEDKVKLNNFSAKSTGSIEDMIGEFNEYMSKLTDERDEKMKDYSFRLNEERLNRQKMQENLSLSISRVSPATSLSLAISSLAGTSIKLKDHFLSEASEYQKTYGDFLKEKTGINPEGRMVRIKLMSDKEEKPEPIDPTELPRFDYKAAGFSGLKRSAVVDIGILIIYNLLLFFGAIMAFNRYDLR